MADQSEIPRATELVYVPDPSWTPIFAAAGLTGILVGGFAGLAWAIIGAIVLLLALIVWIGSTGRDIARMPRSQKLSSAVIPPIPPRSRD